jgi:hypothetical protein
MLLIGWHRVVLGVSSTAIDTPLPSNIASN